MNFFFYDLETSGLDAAYDQILQFAAVRTDEDFNEIEEPIEIFCRVRPDVLPTPTAISINCINVRELEEKGVCEFELAQQIDRILRGAGEQCVIGYNSLEFDDEFIRFLLYRNLLDPYEWHWQNGNNRLDLFQLCGLGFGFDALGSISLDDGKGGLSLKLENLARANGLVHEKAHDALSDVRVTVQLARLIKRNNPKLFEHALKLRNKTEVARIVRDAEMFCHSKSFYTYEKNFLALHAYLCALKTRSNSLISWKLNCDPTDVLGMSADEVREQMYARGDERRLAVGFHDLATNQVPMVTRYNVTKCEQRIQDHEGCLRNLDLVKKHRSQLELLGNEVLGTSIPEKELDADLYHADYFRDVDEDRTVLQQFRLDPHSLEPSRFSRLRFKRQLFRVIARNYPERLTDGKKESYNSWLNNERLGENAPKGCCCWSNFDTELDGCLAGTRISDEQRGALTELRAFLHERHVR